MAKIQNKDFRNYDKEAQELIHGLNSTQKYNLYEIVIEHQQRSQTDVRRKELEAVQRAIDNDPRLDKDRLRGYARGYKSEMAKHARAKDGNTKQNRKKV